MSLSFPFVRCLLILLLVLNVDGSGFLKLSGEVNETREVASPNSDPESVANLNDKVSYTQRIFENFVNASMEIISRMVKVKTPICTRRNQDDLEAINGSNERLQKFDINEKLYNFNLKSDILPDSLQLGEKNRRVKRDERESTHSTEKHTSLRDPEETRLHAYRLKRNTTLPLKVSTANTSKIGLANLLLHIAAQELSDCELVIAYKEKQDEYDVIRKIATLPNLKQVLTIETADDFSSVIWNSLRCRAYLFLWVDPKVILSFTEDFLNDWDYHGKYIFTGLSIPEMERLVATKKGRKTEHILGLQMGVSGNIWRLYTNQLYWGSGVVHINTWGQNGFLLNNEIFPDKTSNLDGVPLKVVIFLWEPSVMFYEDNDGDVVPYGLDFEMLQTLARVMNYTPIYIQPPQDERFGEIFQDGTVTGMVGMVHREEADLGSSNLFISITRVNHIDFSIPFDTRRSCVLLRTEPPLPKWQAIAFPFNAWTWLSIVIGISIAGPVLFLFAKASKLQFAVFSGTELAGFRSLSYCWYYIFGMHLNEPQHQVPYRITTQIFVAFLWLYCMIITIAYSTNLTAFLTVSKTPKGMETIEELPHSGVHVVGVDNYHQIMLRSSPDPNLQALAETYEVHYDSEEVFRQIKSGEAIFMDSAAYLEYTILTQFTKNGVASLRIMKECFASHGVGVALQRHSPLKRRIDQIISRLQQSGLMRRFMVDAIRKAVSLKQSKTNEDNPEEEEEPGGSGIVPLSLDHMQGIFFITIFGWALSAASFCYERLAFSQQQIK